MITDEIKTGIHKDDLLPEMEIAFHLEAKSEEAMYIERQKSVYILYLLAGFAWSPIFRLALRYRLWRHRVWEKKSKTESYRKKTA